MSNDTGGVTVRGSKGRNDIGEQRCGGVAILGSSDAGSKGTRE